MARCEREKLLSADDVTAALSAASALGSSWHEIVPFDSIRLTAKRLLRTHSLRAADSLQLAAAIIASDHDRASLDIVCLDLRLTDAARREGFTVIEE